MGSDSGVGDAELLGDFTVVPAAGEQLEHLTLAAG